MDLRHFRYFVAAVEAGSVRAAAERMHIAQPALSRRIHDLELSLGCQLLERSVRGVTVTAAGAAMYKKASRVLADFDRAIEEVRSLGREQRGEVRLGLVHMSTKYPFLYAGIEAYGEALPQSNLRFMRELSPALATALREGLLDATFLYENVIGRGGAFRDRSVHDEHYVLAVHPEHRLAQGGPVPLAELTGEPLIWLSRPGFEDSRDSLMQQCRRRGLEPHVRYVAGSLEEQMELAIASKGACLTPASSKLSNVSAGLVFRPLSDFDYTLRLSLAWNSHPDRTDFKQLLTCLHEAIDQHQADIVAKRTPWAFLDGHPVILVPSQGAEHLTWRAAEGEPLG